MPSPLFRPEHSDFFRLDLFADIVVALLVVMAVGCSKEEPSASIDPAADYLNGRPAAAEFFNNELRKAKFRNDATKQFWDTVSACNSMQRNWLKAIQDNPKVVGRALTDHFSRELKSVVPELPEDAAGKITSDLMILFAAFYEENEATTIIALDVTKVDTRAVKWTSAYQQWLRMDAAHKQRVWRAIRRGESTDEDVSTAFVESLIRYSLGDTNFSTAWDRTPISRSQMSAELAACEADGRELDTQAATLSAEYMNVRAELAKEYGVDFANITIP